MKLKSSSGLWIAALFLLALAAAARQADAQEAWRYSVTPYLWLPTINGSLNYALPPPAGDGRFDVKVGPNDWLSHLKLAALVTVDARKGPYSLATDIVYLDMGSQSGKVRNIDFAGGKLPIDTTIDSNTKTSLKGLVWTVAGGYAVMAGPHSSLDVIAGVRYLGLDTSVDWQLTGNVSAPGGSHVFPASGSQSKRVDLWDGIVGLRGRAKVGQRWHVPYYFDAGTGTSTLTWQAMSGLSYEYGWGDVGLVYRYLAYDQKADGALQNMSFAGPAVKLSFRF